MRVAFLAVRSYTSFGTRTSAATGSVHDESCSSLLHFGTRAAKGNFRHVGLGASPDRTNRSTFDKARPGSGPKTSALGGSIMDDGLPALR